MSLLSNSLLSTPCIVSRRAISSCDARSRLVGQVFEKALDGTYLVNGRKVHTTRHGILLKCSSVVFGRLPMCFVEGYRAISSGALAWSAVSKGCCLTLDPFRRKERLSCSWSARVNRRDVFNLTETEAAPERTNTCLFQRDFGRYSGTKSHVVP